MRPGTHTRLLPASIEDAQDAFDDLIRWWNALKITPDSAPISLVAPEAYDVISRAMGYHNWLHLKMAISQPGNPPIYGEWDDEEQPAARKPCLRFAVSRELIRLLGFPLISWAEFDAWRAVVCSGFGLPPLQRVEQVTRADEARCWEKPISEHLWRQRGIARVERYCRDAETAARIQFEKDRLAAEFWGAKPPKKLRAKRQRVDLKGLAALTAIK